mmetsp:Transcript_24441/g.56582  ORF Transcript_24441/g.56582 Transcript_24441/m.56582 type:complete len:215 (+) Transcript_24441:250-894(+)
MRRTAQAAHGRAEAGGLAAEGRGTDCRAQRATGRAHCTHAQPASSRRARHTRGVSPVTQGFCRVRVPPPALPPRAQASARARLARERHRGERGLRASARLGQATGRVRELLPRADRTTRGEDRHRPDGQGHARARAASAPPLCRGGRVRAASRERQGDPARARGARQHRLRLRRRARRERHALPQPARRDRAASRVAGPSPLMRARAVKTIRYY